MTTLATLRAPIDRFFEEAIVNDPDPAIRAARLNLLAPRSRGGAYDGGLFADRKLSGPDGTSVLAARVADGGVARDIAPH